MALAAPPPPHLFPEMKALKDLVDLDVAQAKRNFLLEWVMVVQYGFFMREETPKSPKNPDRTFIMLKNSPGA
uniref:Uncharacterized protein n=1 Tax=Oryza meridionalis TaxID=40149 RepID=A0A0E0F2N4_9ORYZ